MLHSDKFLNENTKNDARDVFVDAVDRGIHFKLQDQVRSGDIEKLIPNDLIEPMPIEGSDLQVIEKQFNDQVLPYCYNFASSNFMGFPDAGNSIAAIAGNITADFMQQNLINQSFCSPSGTFVEMSVIRWLREVVGYDNPDEVNDIYDVGGVITGGGTTSNTIGILLARENYQKNTMFNGVNVEKDDGYYVVVPKGIGHYSVKSAQMWLGCGNRLIEVETDNFRYDLKKLEEALHTYKGRIMAVVAYAGDSRTMTVDNFTAIESLVRSIDPNIWLHADACHGFSLGFSDTLKAKLKGIEKFDSITTDPHKVLNSPYTISSLLVREPAKMKTVSSQSDLIMQETFAFGQITPFIGSKPWMSLKLWYAIKHLGKKGIGEIIDQRHATAVKFSRIIQESDDFTLINKVDINSVAFMYTGKNMTLSVDQINALNQDIHSLMIKEGVYHLHQFSIPDAGIFEKGKIIYPHRFMSGNPNITEKNLYEVLDYIRKCVNDLTS